MNQIVSVTYARNNLKALLDQIVKQGKRFILVRESAPEAAIIPYEDILQKEQIWNERFNKAMKASQKYFLKWLKAKGVDPKSLTEDKVYELIKKT